MNHFVCNLCASAYPKKEQADACCCEPQRALTGGSSKYYWVDVTKPLEGHPYSAQCLDIIMALKMDFAEGEAFKAIWRKAAARLGNGKAGNTALYNAEKVAFMGGVMVQQEMPQN